MPQRLNRNRWTVHFFAAGFLAMPVQVFLLRELVVNAAGDEAAIGAGLALWLLGIALGARFLRVRESARVARMTRWLFAILVLSGPLGILASRASRAILAPPPGELPGVGNVLLLAAVCLLPAGITVGGLFTSLANATKKLWEAETGIRQLYIGEAAGSLLGGTATTIACGLGIQPLVASLGLSAFAACLIIASMGSRPRGGARPLYLAAFTVLLCAVFEFRLDSASEALRFSGIAKGIEFRASLHTPYQHMIIAGQSPAYLYSSGRFVAAFPDPWTSETLAHEVACLTPEPSRILALGPVVLGTLRFLLLHPVKQIDIVEPDQEALRFVRRYLAPEDARALEDKRVTILHGDPRRYLARSGSPYDVILLFGQDPANLSGARFSSREFFQECRRHLSRDGVLVLPARTAPAALAGDTEPMAGAQFGALLSVFPVVRSTPGPESLFVAGSSDEVTLAPEILESRFKERKIESDVFAREQFAANFMPGRVIEMENALKRAAASAAPSTDDRPLSFLYALSRKQGETGSLSGEFLLQLGKCPPAALVALVLVPHIVAAVIAWRRRSAVSAVSHIVWAAGAVGMLESLLLLYSFQAREGALYGEIGLLTAIFMLGLAAGGWAQGRGLSLRQAAVGAFLSASVVALLIPFLPMCSGLGAGLSIGVHACLLFLAGLQTGVVFPAAAQALTANGMGVQQAASALATADHAGAVLAALTGAVLLIPGLGLQGTAWLGVVLLAIHSTGTGKFMIDSFHAKGPSISGRRVPGWVLSLHLTGR